MRVGDRVANLHVSVQGEQFKKYIENLGNEVNDLARWVTKAQPPSFDEALSHGGWFYVRSIKPEGGWNISVRCFDDTDNSWWSFNNNHDVRTLTPNNYFDEWLRLSREALG